MAALTHRCLLHSNKLIIRRQCRPEAFFCTLNDVKRNNSGAHEERSHIVEDLACTRHRRCMQRSQPIVQSNYLRLPRAYRAHSLAAISDKHHPIKPRLQHQTHHTFRKTSAITRNSRRHGQRDRGSRQPDVQGWWRKRQSPHTNPGT